MGFPILGIGPVRLHLPLSLFSPNIIGGHVLSLMIVAVLCFLLIPTPAPAEYVDGYNILVQNISYNGNHLEIEGRVSGGEPCPAMLVVVGMSDHRGRHKNVRCQVNYTGQGKIFRGSMWIGDRQAGWTQTRLEVQGCDSSPRSKRGPFKDSMRDIYSARFAMEPKGDFIEVTPIYRNSGGGFVFWSGDTLRISYSVYENVGEYNDPIKGGLLQSGGDTVRNADERVRIPTTVSMRNARGLIIECSANPGRLISDVAILGYGIRPATPTIPTANRTPSLPPNSDPEPPSAIRKWQDEHGNWHFTDF